MLARHTILVSEPDKITLYGTLHFLRTLEGKLPAELRGTVFRNGPGQFGQFGRRYTHPFEADGAVSAIRLESGRAFGASKLTASAGLAEERDAGRVLYGLSAPWLRRACQRA